MRVIEVVPYSSKWKEEYNKESQKLINIFGEEVISIHHIGSTSIPGIYAKPVIDILIEVREIEIIDRFNSAMESIGYIAKGENGIEGRRYFFKGLYDRTHHVHIFQSGSEEISRHLNFRDYMIAHPEEAKQYGELKKQLAERFKYDIEGYCDGKDAFIKEIDRKALEWAADR